MDRKKKQEQPVRAMTKRQLSHHRRELRRQRIIRTAGIVIIVAVILTVLVGWYLGEYRPLHQTVLEVNDTGFTMEYYIDTLKAARGEQPVERLEDMAPGVATDIARNEIIRQGALQLGYRVTDSEVTEVLKGTDLEVNDALRDIVRSELLAQKLVEQYFKPQVPASMSQVNIRAMMLEDEAQAVDIRNRLATGDNFSALAEEYSLDPYSKSLKGEIGWHPQDVLYDIFSSPVPGAYAFGSGAGQLSQPRYDADRSKPSGYWLVKVLEKQYEDEAQVQALLLSNEAEAADIRARLEAGEDLVALAEQYSQYEQSKKNGGELGLVTEGLTTEALDGYIFSPDLVIGAWSQPIRDEAVSTRGSWWLVEVLEKDDDRLLAEEDRNLLVSKISEAWLSTILTAGSEGVVDHLDPDLRAWAVKKAAQG